MKRMIPLVATLSLVAIIGFGCVNSQTIQKQTTTGAPKIDRSAILLDAKAQGLIMDTQEIDHMKDSSVLFNDVKKQSIYDVQTFIAQDLKTWHAAALADVTGGGSFGLAHTNTKNGLFSLVATLGSLPVLNNGSHYEGWLVKRGDGMFVVNLGEAQKNGDKYMNAYKSGTDLSSYDFYVLTIESGNAASGPSEHILEGVIR